MGIKGLMKLISDHAACAIKEKPISSYLGSVVAIDASMSLYQFLIAVRSGNNGEVLTNDAGEVTSHLIGMFYRTIRMVDHGIKPIYIFDGKAPVLKRGELDKRALRREEAEQELKNAQDGEDNDEVVRQTKRLVKVTSDHRDEAIRLLKLMGIPIVEAPSEAEAQCAELVKKDVAYGVATEDMDALTFGTKRLIRHLTMSEARKLPIVEIDLQKCIEELNLSMQEFVDLCILCGCDYTASIRGIGPHTALKLIQTHKTIKAVLENIDKKKYTIPEDFLHEEAAKLFVTPEVIDGNELRDKIVWADPDEEGLIQYLVTEKGFALERVKTAVKKLREARPKASQKRMENFFQISSVSSSSTSSSKSKSTAGEKRKATTSKSTEKATVKKGKK